ncbi:hypothetical protein [Fluviicola taffensis]|uniref:Uncharacterized protein n=1 Tax=Fluviicola taffensis (strain DSM 16823 / NCIMB 13979 / RW262) TaxID=755732 RepID=F2IIH0_FLUTR|nr:hypothetical protein [Fluviicola taffensis]AEA44896.1 hypothetical protein Fluta_2917 [Fluviicola taffensis DSM 16823]
MKIDFLSDINSVDFANNMVQITSYTSEEVKMLVILLKELVSGRRNSIRTNEIDFIQTEKYVLEFKSSDENRGLYRVSDERFVCDLNHEGYEELINLLTPFESGSGGFQFLVDPSVNDIELLISPGGEW